MLQLHFLALLFNEELLLVKKYVGAFMLLNFEFGVLLLAPESIFFDSLVFGFFDSLIVELVPFGFPFFGFLLNEGVVVATFRSSRVDHHSSEPVCVKLVWHAFFP